MTDDDADFSPQRQGLEAHMAMDYLDSELRDLFDRTHRERFDLFIDQLVENSEAWGLSKGKGWCLGQAEGDTRAVAMWPHPALAQSCAEGTWEGAIPKRLALDTLLNELLPTLAEDGLTVVVFPQVDGAGVVVSPKDLYQQVKRRQLKKSRE